MSLSFCCSSWKLLLAAVMPLAGNSAAWSPPALADRLDHAAELIRPSRPRASASRALGVLLADAPELPGPASRPATGGSPSGPCAAAAAMSALARSWSCRICWSRAERAAAAAASSFSAAVSIGDRPAASPSIAPAPNPSTSFARGPTVN
eukprot:scaffold1557_cov108-Isochrysis_galbana.AAC.6